MACSASSSSSGARRQQQQRRGGRRGARGGVLDVVLSFDTTGSMYAYLSAVRTELDSLLTTLVAEAKAEGVTLRVGVIAHGDYCDKQSSYVIKFLPLLSIAATADGRNHRSTAGSDNVAKLRAFISEVGATGGGDSPECYELALQKASSAMHWSPAGSTRLLIMVGDATPHAVGYTCRGYTNRLCWKQQLQALRRKHVHIYAVQAGNDADATAFWKELARATRGKHLQITQLDTMSRLVTAAALASLSERAVSRYSRTLAQRGLLKGETGAVMQQITSSVVVRVVTTTTRRQLLHLPAAGGAAAAATAAVAAAAAGAGAVVGVERTTTRVTTTTVASPGAAAGRGGGARKNKKRAAAAAPGAAAAGGAAAAAAAPSSRLCRFFNSPAGCTRAATGCSFAHVKARRGQRACRFFNSPGGCNRAAAGKPCRFLHLAVCRFFSSKSGCTAPPASPCTFAHVKLAG